MRNCHHADDEVGLVRALSISVAKESATVVRADLGMRAITLVQARSLAKPAAIPQAGTSDGWLDGSEGAGDRPRHSWQCQTVRARAWVIVSLAQDVCHRWLQRLQLIAAFRALRLLHALQLRACGSLASGGLSLFIAYSSTCP